MKRKVLGKGLGDVVDRNDVSINKGQELAGEGTRFVEIRGNLLGDL